MHDFFHEAVACNKSVSEQIDEVFGDLVVKDLPQVPWGFHELYDMPEQDFFDSESENLLADPVESCFD
jgi:hypothetical protein